MAGNDFEAASRTESPPHYRLALVCTLACFWALPWKSTIDYGCPVNIPVYSRQKTIGRAAAPTTLLLLPLLLLPLFHAQEASDTVDSHGVNVTCFHVVAALVRVFFASRPPMMLPSSMAMAQRWLNLGASMSSAW